MTFIIFNSITFLLAFVLHENQAFSLPKCTNNEQSESAFLCTKYDNFSKVDYPQPAPCNISVIVGINDIKSIDEELQVINFKLTLFTKWIDNRIALDFASENKPSNYPFHQVIGDEFSAIWKPRILFSNAIQATLEDSETKEIWYEDPSIFLWAQTFFVSLSCKMVFSEFPFDSHNCTLKLLNSLGVNKYVELMEPEVFFEDFEEYVYEGNPERLKFDVKISSMPSSQKIMKSSCFQTTNIHSQANVNVQLTRKRKAILVLTSEFYLWTFTYSILSLVSYFISVESVPGRMGLLITLYLIAINNYVSTEVPSTRGISYMDIWFIGSIVPVVFAIIEYGILLAILKYGNGYRVNILLIDKVAFFVSLIYITVFDTFYGIATLNGI